MSFGEGTSQLEDFTVRNLKVTWPDFSLSADFQIRVGERVALIGKSGSGKTTLLRALAGLEPVEPGAEILLGGRNLAVLPAQKREIGFLFQDHALFESMNVLDNCTFALRMQGVARSIRDEEGRRWLKKVSLAEHALSSVTTLSGGERQRVAFIRALIGRPRLIFLDEPFSSLDLELRETLRREFRDLHTLWPAPVLLVTHDEGDILALATARLKLRWDSGHPDRKITRELTTG
ncbi:MAG: ATP-binding cassette domain-containing protein [Bdellovibrio sp.]|nr:ATP-binding cassette domain-containing protein [Bdellovibrio sp.]